MQNVGVVCHRPCVLMYRDVHVHNYCVLVEGTIYKLSMGLSGWYNYNRASNHAGSPPYMKFLRLGDTI